MGMDVYGKSPTSEVGSYFRNNVWWWRPLWEYCETQHPEICSGVSGAYNDGDGLDADGAAELGKALLADVASGKTKAYGDKYREWQKSLPKEPCTYCATTGIRTDDVGKDMGQDKKELDDEDKVLYGRTHGWCNGCDGAGWTDNFALNYPFDSENVQQFAEFCLASGGFEIW
jgi:hypothetical protein